MIENMIVFVFIQYVYNFLNDLKEINELLMDVVIVQKILKNLPKKYEIFIEILWTEKVISCLSNWTSRLHI